MPLKMTASCRALVTRGRRHARWARWRARLLPRAARQRFISDLASPAELDAMLEAARRLSAPLDPPHLEKLRGDLFDLTRLPDFRSQGRWIASDLGLSSQTSLVTSQETQGWSAQVNR